MVNKADFEKAREILAPAFGLKQVNEDELLGVPKEYFDPNISYFMLISMILNISSFFKLHEFLISKQLSTEKRSNTSAIFYSAFLSIIAYTPYETAKRLSLFSKGELNKQQRDRLKAVKRAMKIFYPELEF